MLPAPERNQIDALLTEMRMLMQAAQVRGDLAAPNDGFVPDYWYGVATGYQDAIERLEALLRTPKNNRDRVMDTRDDNDTGRADYDSSLFMPLPRFPKK